MESELLQFFKWAKKNGVSVKTHFETYRPFEGTRWRNMHRCAMIVPDFTFINLGE